MNDGCQEKKIASLEMRIDELKKKLSFAEERSANLLARCEEFLAQLVVHDKEVIDHRVRLEDERTLRLKAEARVAELSDIATDTGIACARLEKKLALAFETLRDIRDKSASASLARSMTMSEPKIPPDIEAQFQRIERFYVVQVMALVDKYPQFRKTFACGRLGGAIAFADSKGEDVEGFLAHLRKHREKPSVFLPRKS